RKRGSGTVVTAGGRALRQALSETRALLQYASASTFVITPPRLIALKPAVARVLGRPADESWYHIRGLRVMDGAREPIAFTDAFLHLRFAAHVEKLESGQEALFAQLQRLAGVEVGRVAQEIQAIAANAIEAEALSVPRGTACLRIIRHYFDRSGDLFEMSCSVHPGERFSYMVETTG
ncbi:MAG: UTRA domain-containing protein, partial [Sphingomonadaceae bacterium]